MFDWFLKAALVIEFEIIFSLQDRIFSNFLKSYVQGTGFQLIMCNGLLMLLDAMMVTY